MISDPNCKLCSADTVGTFFHMIWDCPPVLEFWEMVAHNLSVMFGSEVPPSPAILLLNDLSTLGLTPLKSCALLARLTAAKKKVAMRWKPPHTLSFRAWVLMYLDIVYLELSTARVHGAK